jgi:hypothetical protein
VVLAVHQVIQQHLAQRLPLLLLLLQRHKRYCVCLQPLLHPRQLLSSCICFLPPVLLLLAVRQGAVGLQLVQLLLQLLLPLV